MNLDGIKIERTDIQMGLVYSNDTGETRLVVSASFARNGRPSFVQWRTNDQDLDRTRKSHGSCTIPAFAKWAVSSRAASQEDWAAFEHVENRRRWRANDRKAIVRIKKELRATGKI